MVTTNRTAISNHYDVFTLATDEFRGTYTNFNWARDFAKSHFYKVIWRELNYTIWEPPTREVENIEIDYD